LIHSLITQSTPFRGLRVASDLRTQPHKKAQEQSEKRAIEHMLAAKKNPLKKNSFDGTHGRWSAPASILQRPQKQRTQTTLPRRFLPMDDEKKSAGGRYKMWAQRPSSGFDGG